MKPKTINCISFTIPHAHHLLLFPFSSFTSPSFAARFSFSPPACPSNYRFCIGKQYLHKCRVICHFRPWGLAKFATSVQMFVLLNLDLKGLKSCHFHPTR
ncbi:hypothetical protein Hanom_Chr04g00280891 [Helianthus anomalus]